ncbi:MAG TPA: rhodanese-like domain-containing protein [Candidatus Polarisedimenticolaceae bacterium]
MLAVLFASMFLPPSVVQPADLAGPGPERVILDARASMKDYLAGHLPGALWVGPDNWRSTAEGVPGEIHPPEVFRTLFGRLGLRPDDEIVVYGAISDPDAALVASVLRMHGLAAAILDGGIDRWKREGRPISNDLPRPPTSRPRVARATGAIAAYDEVLAASKSRGNAVIVDVRPPEQYEAGRIPGAVSFFWKRNLWPEEGVSASGCLRSARELLEAYRALGITPDKTVYVYCNSGHMAALGWFVLKHYLGFRDVRLYDGSWIDWSARPGAPTESGKPGEAKARAAADALTRDLQSRLVAEMRDGGPTRAVSVTVSAGR